MSLDKILDDMAAYTKAKLPDLKDSRMAGGRTRVVANVAATPTADFTRNADLTFPLDSMSAAIVDTVGQERGERACGTSTPSSSTAPPTAKRSAVSSVSTFGER